MKILQTRKGSRIHRLLGGRSNVFLVRGGGLDILVDTGIAWSWEALRRRLDENKVEKLDYLVVTHAHFDHAGNAARVREKYGSKVMAHRSEAGYLQGGQNAPIDGIFRPIRGLVRGFVRNQSGRLAYSPCPADILVEERFDFAPRLEAALLPTPGHTPGSISIVVDGEIAMVGDAMFGIVPWSAMPPFGIDRREIVLSWGKLLETGCRIFLPSHGMPKSRARIERGMIRNRPS
jgi:hydroxyacylglutathione hydrolase